MDDNTGVGFDTSKHQIYENFLTPKREKIRCSFCNKNGHIESFCFYKKGMTTKHSHEHSSQNKERSFIKKECTYCKRSGHVDTSCFLKIKNLERLKTNNEGPTESGVPKTPLTQNAGILSKCKEKALVLRQWLL